jgi:Phasin protein
MFESIGEMTPPCGVPSVAKCRFPASRTPAFSHLSLEKAIEIQTAYAKTAYEGFMAQATKMTELYINLAKELSGPLEKFVPKVPVAK